MSQQPSQYPPNYQPQQPQYPYQQPGIPPQMNQYQQWQVQGQFTKSYTTPAVITLVLYLFLWIPGLIANIVYLLEANKTKQVTGTTPDGYGCLWALLCVVAAPGVLAGLIFMFALFASLGAASH
jgi:hypothetical protein